MQTNRRSGCLNLLSLMFLAIILAFFLHECSDGETHFTPQDDPPSVPSPPPVGNSVGYPKAPIAKPADIQPPKRPAQTEDIVVPTQEAAQQLIQTAMGGNDLAQLLLSMRYFWGNKFIPKDYRKCIYWARRSAIQGNKNAIESLQGYKTIAAIDPVGVYSIEDRKKIEEALEAPFDPNQPPEL